jgi:hypothetical protein
VDIREDRITMVQHLVYTLGADGKMSLKKAGDFSAGKATSADGRAVEHPAPGRKKAAYIAGQLKAFFDKPSCLGSSANRSEPYIQTSMENN